MPADLQSLAAVQSAIDRARRAGETITPPVIGRVVSQAASFAGSLGSAGSMAGGSTSFDDVIKQAAAKEGIDPTLVKAVARAESNLNPGAVSSAGAKGVMQLMDGTARELGVRDSFDPAQNIAGGAKYLKQLLNRYGGDVKRALAAYNAGPGAVDASGGIPPYAETQAYVQRVLRFREGEVKPTAKG
jgi:soluble lytic murein transglycosylase-like protein